jgi:hypothetical protein
MAHMALRVWGADVRRGSFGGHDGLTYEGLTYDEGPSTFGDLVAATEKWTDRTFLVHGERRISFTEFRAAIGAARRVVAYFAVPTRWQIRTEPLPTLAGEKVDKTVLARDFTG